MKHKPRNRLHGAWWPASSARSWQRRLLQVERRLQRRAMTTDLVRPVRALGSCVVTEQSSMNPDYRHSTGRGGAPLSGGGPLGQRGTGYQQTGATRNSRPDFFRAALHQSGRPGAE